MIIMMMKSIDNEHRMSVVVGEGEEMAVFALMSELLGKIQCSKM